MKASVDKQNDPKEGTMPHKNHDIGADMQAIRDARHADPFSVLGLHTHNQQANIRTFLPHTESVRIIDSNTVLERIPGTDFFISDSVPDTLTAPYQLETTNAAGQIDQFYDPYSFPPQVSDYDLYLYGEGRHWQAWHWLGAHIHKAEGVKGVLFAVWAPNAERVSVVGDFNQWDGRCHPMRLRGNSGVWELFIPNLNDGELYNFEVRAVNGDILLKSDPYARQFESSSATSNRIVSASQYAWGDQNWLEQRQHRDWLHAPLSIYEVHLGSWQRDAEDDFLSYRELAERLVEHVHYMGFTHVELLPIAEHPFYGSWGYQTTGYYAPCSRYGDEDDLRYLVDLCHKNNIGVIVDWVPAHFPKDAHGLARFDGTALYEHADPRRGEHRDWNTLIFNYGRHEVSNFLIANALYWLDEFHIDGLRVDAVASLLYLDFAREKDDWLPNKHGGRENIEAVEFIKQLNIVSHEQFPGTIMMAEESTDWPNVSRRTDQGGLGFSMKWNMGWMHDVLDYMKLEPVHRRYHHNKLTFGMMYNKNENFILPFSHDEVVHEKASLRYKMSGDEWQQFANLRLLYLLMYTHPGKQLLFMGNEFGQGREWNHDQSLDWHLLDYPLHQGLLKFVSDLNHINRSHPALHYYDFEERGFKWINCDDSIHSVLSFKRMSDDETVIVILNFTPVPRQHYRIGVDQPGHYSELLNTDADRYGGSNVSNGQGYDTDNQAWMDFPCSIAVDLPPLGGIILKQA